MVFTNLGEYMNEPTIAQKGPYLKEVNVGKYAWCACGNSKNQPFCDGSHKGTEFSPILISVPDKKNIAFCGCKHSNNKPYCDGSHRNV